MTSPGKVLFYHPSPSSSEAELRLLQMLPAAAQRFAEVVVCSAGSGGSSSLLEHGATRMMAVPPLPVTLTGGVLRLLVRCVGSLAALSRLRKLIAEQAPELLHANGTAAGFFASLATTGTHTRILWHLEDDLGPAGIASALRKLAFRSPRCTVVAASQAAARAFAGPLNFGLRLQVLRQAIDAEAFPRRATPPDPQASQIRTGLGLVPADFLAVALGPLHPNQGLLQLLYAFADVQAGLGRIRRTAAHLVIAATPTSAPEQAHEQALRARVDQLNLSATVHLLPEPMDRAALLRAADIFLLPALEQPRCRSLLEAFASGTPVISSNVGGVPEVLEDQVSGQLVLPPYERRQTPGSTMADRLLASITDPHALLPMAEEAFVEVLPRFTLTACALRLDQIYDAVLLEHQALPVLPPG